ncbi:MAG: nickel/cobalt exporter [Haloarculaceae archaeon]|jgi:nickel/cobalt exporter
MLHTEALGLLVGAVALGAIHGIEPGHGWPVAASYALDQTNKWLYGFAASFILGVGHLISSIAMVAVFFYAKGYFDLTQANEPIELVDGLFLGGPVSIVAGVLLILLGIREYRHGHSQGGHGHEAGHDQGDHTHEHGSGHSHSDAAPHESVLADLSHHDHGNNHDHAHAHQDGHDDSDGFLPRLKLYVPFVGDHSHSHGRLEEATDRGLLGIAWFAFLLGFAHEEEFEIIALCAGSNYCLELMSAYALTVIAGIVGLTMLLIAGYEHYQETVEQYTPYLPAFSATVLIVMGLGFIIGVF